MVWRKIVHIEIYSVPYSVWMRKNTDENNFEYGYFSRSGSDWLIGYLPETIKSAVPALWRGEIDDNVDQDKPQVKTLIESQLKEIQSTEIIMTWKRPVKSAVTLDPEDIGEAQDGQVNAGNRPHEGMDTIQRLRDELF